MERTQSLAGLTYLGPPQALMTKHFTFQGEKICSLQVNHHIFKKEYRTGFLGKFLATIKGCGFPIAFPNFSLGLCVCCYCSVAKSTTACQASLSFTIAWESVCLSAANSNPFDYPGISLPGQQRSFITRTESYLQAFWVISCKELPVIQGIMLVNRCKHGVLGNKREGHHQEEKSREPHPAFLHMVRLNHQHKTIQCSSLSRFICFEYAPRGPKQRKV